MSDVAKMTVVDQTVELAEIVRVNTDGNSFLGIAEAIIAAGYRKESE